MSAVHIADAGPRSIRIYTDDNRPRLVATIRALDSGSVDELLRAYGWKRVGPWAREDDTPEGHKVAAIERIDGRELGPAIEVVERDQAAPLCQPHHRHQPGGRHEILIIKCGLSPGRGM